MRAEALEGMSAGSEEASESGTGVGEKGEQFGTSELFALHYYYSEWGVVATTELTLTEA